MCLLNDMMTHVGRVTHTHAIVTPLDCLCNYDSQIREICIQVNKELKCTTSCICNLHISSYV